MMTSICFAKALDRGKGPAPRAFSRISRHPGCHYRQISRFWPSARLPLGASAASVRLRLTREFRAFPVADIFHEVEEELRKDKYNELLRKWGPWALGGAVAIVLAATGWQAWEYFQNRQSNAMSDRYLEAIAMVGDGELEAADAALASLAEDGSNGYAGLALMQRGDIALQNGDPAAAGYLFEQAAEEFSTVPFSDLARVKAAMALFDELSLDDLQNRLTEVMEPNRPYRLLAREVIAAKAFAIGDMDRAYTEYSAIADDIDALALPISQRAQAAVGLIDRIRQQQEIDGAAASEADAESLMPDLPETETVDPETFNLGSALQEAEDEMRSLATDSPSLPDAASALDNSEDTTAEDGQD